MESEMQKQRVRTLDILAEKENELETTKYYLLLLIWIGGINPPEKGH